MFSIGDWQGFSEAVIQTGIGLAALLAFIEAVKPKGNRWFITLALLAIILQLRFLFSITGYLFKEPWAGFPAITALAAFGPTMLFAGINAARFAFEEKKYRLPLHYLPAGLTLTAELLFQLEPRSIKAAALTGLESGNLEANAFLLANGLAGLVFVGYIVYLNRLFHELTREYRLVYPLQTRLVLVLPLISILLTGTGILSGSAGLYHTGGWAVTVLLGLVFVLKETAPGFFEAMRAEVKARRYAKTQLNGIDVPAVKKRLTELMTEGHLYRDEELRLALVADELLLSSNKLSRIINEEFGKNFFEFINDYRIEEACSLLVAEPESSVLSIAYRVGFNTKTTFNIQFNKLKGMNPTEYRKQKRSSGPKKQSRH